MQQETYRGQKMEKQKSQTRLPTGKPSGSFLQLYDID
jgi:hypothetical protein